jgi:hypothetical protein
MCLNNLAKFDVKQRYGYVVKYRWGEGYCSLYYHSGIAPRKLMIGREQMSQQVPVECLDGKTYASGWHIFLKKEDAKAYRHREDQVILMARFREIIARGEEIYENPRKSDKIVISRYITLLKEVK